MWAEILVAMATATTTATATDGDCGDDDVKDGVHNGGGGDSNGRGHRQQLTT